MPKDYDYIKAYKSNEEIANAAHAVLTRHKLPLHYQYIARLVAIELEKEPDMVNRSWESKVLIALNTHPMWFIITKSGVYTI